MSENVTRRLAEKAHEEGWTDRIAFHSDGVEWSFSETFDRAALIAAGYRAR